MTVPKQNTPLFISWNEMAQTELAQVGNKAWNIYRLAKAGFQIPPGGVIPMHVYYAFLRYNGLHRPAEQLGHQCETSGTAFPEALRSRVEKLHAAITAGRFPAQLKRQLTRDLVRKGLHNISTAVRSSAGREDSAQASFAGMFSSDLHVIGIDAILESVKRCYASLWTERALRYANSRQCRPGGMAVIVMALVNAQAAGVAFTADPHTASGATMHISANWGLGESVVSGRVTPDVYVVAPELPVPRVIKKNLGKKEWISVPHVQGGTASTEPEVQPAAKIQVLSDGHILDLTWMLMHVKDRFAEESADYDVEWAFDGSDMYLLQIRPLPASSRQGRSQWAYSYFTPGKHSLLGWSTVHPFLEEMFLAPFKAVQPKYRAGRSVVKYFEQRIYFHYTYLEHEMKRVFGMSSSDFGEAFGGRSGRALGEESGTRLSYAQQWSRIKSLVKMVRIYRKTEAFLGTVENAVRGLAGDLSQGTAETLLEDCLKIHDLLERSESAKKIQLLYIYSSVAHQFVVHSLKPVFSGRAVMLANTILSEASQVLQQDHSFALWRLFESIRDDRASVRLLKEKQFNAQTWQNNKMRRTQVGALFQSYLFRFGHRCVEETDIANVRWRENPAYLIDCLQQLAKKNDFARLLQSKAGRREKAWQEIRSKTVWWHLQLIKRLAGHAQASAAKRERAKSTLALVLDVLRQRCLELGRRLSGEKRIRQPEDIFYCTWPELVLLIRGTWQGKPLTALIAARKQQAKAAPEFYRDVLEEGGGQPQPGRPGGKKAARLSGLGVASGVSRGRVRILNRPEEGAGLKAGDVLVTSCIDPGWTPLLLRVSGLVVEKGGYLSHGAIVAREYGIPAVSNIPNVTRLLKNGQSVRINGDTGSITLG